MYTFGVDTYVKHLIIDPRLLADCDEWPDTAVVVDAAELDVVSPGGGVLTVAALVETSNDARLLTLSEAWTGEDRDDKLFESRSVGLILVEIGVGTWLTQDLHECLDSCEGNLEQLITLPEKDVLDCEPWKLVDGVDDTVVGADQATTDVLALQDVSPGQDNVIKTARLTWSGISQCLIMCA